MSTGTWEHTRKRMNAIIGALSENGDMTVDQIIEAIGVSGSKSEKRAVYRDVNRMRGDGILLAKIKLGRSAKATWYSVQPGATING